MINRLRQIHRFMLSQSVYPIALSTLLALGTLAARMYLTRSWDHSHMVWNLGLAWVPYLCSLWMASIHRRHPRRWWALVPLGVLWLAFFPNAPYLVTDLWHLWERPPVPLWYDLGLLVAFAWTGCFLAVASLRTVQMQVKAFLGWAASWIFVAGTIGLSGLGVYLGRFMRWNSWDLALRPRSVMADVLPWLIDPLSHRQPYGVTVMFAALLLVCYLMFVSAQHHERTELDS